MVFFGQFIKNNENVAGAEQDGARRERAEREEEGLGEVGATFFIGTISSHHPAILVFFINFDLDLIQN